MRGSLDNFHIFSRSSIRSLGNKVNSGSGLAVERLAEAELEAVDSEEVVCSMSNSCGMIALEVMVEVAAVADILIVINVPSNLGDSKSDRHLHGGLVTCSHRLTLIRSSGRLRM